MLLFSSLHRTPSRFLHHSAYFCLPHPLSNSVTSPYVSHLNPPPLSPPSLSSPARCLWFTFEVFIPPAVPSLSSHPHTLTSSSRFSPSLSLTFLCSPLIASPSSPTVFPPSPCASQITVFAADTFIAVRPIEPEEGATPTRVTLSLPLHPAARNPPIFSSAAAFWDPSFPPSLSSKSPRPLCVALSFVPRSSVTKLLKPPLMTSPIQEFQVPFLITWRIEMKDFEQSCVRL